MSLSELPPVEAMTGLRVRAICSIKIQSLISELANLMIWMPNSAHEAKRLWTESEHFQTTLLV